MADTNSSAELKEQIKKRIPEQYKKEAEAAEGLYDDIKDIQIKTAKKTGKAMDASAIPDYVDAGIKAAEAGGGQSRFNKLFLYLDNPENEKTTKVINQIRKYWNKLPGLVQAKIIHDLGVNEPTHLFLRMLAKTGILQYKRETKPEDTRTLGKTTRKALVWIFKLIKPFIKELRGVDSRIVDGIMKGAGFLEDYAYNAKLAVINARRKRMGTKKTLEYHTQEELDEAARAQGGSATPITAAKSYSKPSGKPNPKRVRRAA
jgi:hypothetical protein